MTSTPSNSTPSNNSYDVIVIGAGPAGTATAATLAEKGHRVLILEREGFPRYKVGESLIPYCWYPLQRLGMIEQLRASQFTDKQSVQFVGMSGRVSTPFYFSQHTDHECAYTWQVVRSEFDQMLLDNAIAKGAQVLMPATARSLIRDDNNAVVGVRAQTSDGDIEFHAPITVDASGRDLFAIKANDWRVPDTDLQKIAVWTYYKGAMRDEGRAEGATTVAYIPEKGWFWYIPLPDDSVSVGVVAERDYLYRDARDPQAILDREIAIQPWIKEHLSTGTQISEPKVTGDYSYRAKHCAEDGLVLVGDAFSFLDPVFSSGVFLALQSGVMAGDAIDSALASNNVTASQFTHYGSELCKGIEAMRKLVYAFYNDEFSFGHLLKKHPELREDLTDCLIGHLYKDFDPLFNAVAEFAKVPAALTHGAPRVNQNV